MQAYALFAGDVAYVWHGALHGDVVGADLAACGLQPRAQIVWVKQHFTLSRGHYCVSASNWNPAIDQRKGIDVAREM